MCHERTTAETEMDRDIGIVGGISLGVGTMTAAGIFVLSGLAVSNVGAMAIVAFGTAPIVASFTAFAYAEFAGWLDRFLGPLFADGVQAAYRPPRGSGSCYRGTDEAADP